MTDPILEELWAIKDEISEETGHDLRRLFELLKKNQTAYSDRLVNRCCHPFVAAESARPEYKTH